MAALTDVTTDFPAGTFTAIMGASGSGKSTLLQCAAGLDRVDSGEVVIAGTTLSSLNENALTRMRREQIGFVFQSFNLVPSLTARQNVELPMRLAGASRRTIGGHQRARRARPGRPRETPAQPAFRRTTANGWPSPVLW